MTSTNTLKEVCDMLDTYGGRDKIMKALCYITKLAGGLSIDSHNELAQKLLIFSSKISGARTTLRLVDDVPLLKYSLDYGLGRKEPDRTMSIIGVIANIVDHIYYPVEKICWLAEHKLLNVKDPSKWDVVSSVFWVMSIYLNLMKSVRLVAMMEQHKRCLAKLDNQSATALSTLHIKQTMELISVVRLSLDLLQAGSTLPKGYLWGGKLQTWHVGLIGSLSAFIGIYQYFSKKQISK